MKSNAESLQITLPFIYKDKFLLILGAVCGGQEQNLQNEQEVLRYICTKDAE